MGWLSSLISGGFSLLNNAANYSHQKRENQRNRDFQAEQAQINRDFQSKEAELAYERQLDYYNQTQSPAAMVEQYQEAGLNPALALGGASGVSSPQYSPSGSMVSSTSSSLPQMQDILKSAIDIESIKAGIKESEARARKTDAETESIEKNTSWIDVYNTTSIDSMKAGIQQIESNIAKNSQQINESIQNVQESIKRMDVMDSQIEVNGALVDLHGSQSVLNDTKAAINRLDAKKLEILMPYVAAAREAEIALTTANTRLADAKTEEAKNQANLIVHQSENAMYEANLKFLKILVDTDLISSGYYESIVDQAHWDAKYKKREYKWKPVNDLCHNLSMLAIGAGSVMSGTSSVMSGTANMAIAH